MMKRTRTSPRPDRSPPNATKWRALRLACHLTQRQMAGLLGCSIDTVYRMESGKQSVRAMYVYAYKAIAAERGCK